MKRLALALLFALLPWISEAATTYYICGCGTSADARCAAGNVGAADANTGQAPVWTAGTNGPWLTTTKFRSSFSGLAKGDTVSFCDGGAWDITDASATTDIMDNLNNTANNAVYPGVVAAADYITINSYRPSWMPAGETGTATSVSVGAGTVTRTGAGWTVNQWANYVLVLYDAQYNVPQYLEIASNTADTLTLRSLTFSRYFYDTPSSTTAYEIQPPWPRVNVTRAGTSGQGMEFDNSGNPALGQGIKVTGLHFNGVVDGQSISGITFDGTNATVTTSASHLLATGASIIITGVSPSAANKQTTATVTGATTFTYPCTTSSGCSGVASGGAYKSYGATGMAISNGKRWVTVDGVRINGFGSAVTCNGGYSSTVIASGEGLTRYITLRNSQITNASDTGYGGGCYQTLIENNRFDTISYNIGHHIIYTYDPNWPTSFTPISPPASDGIVIRSNILKNNSVLGGNACPSVSVVVHGLKDDYQFINNRGQEDSLPTSSNCWFFSADAGYYRASATPGRYEAEAFNRAIIRGNQAVNYAQGFSLDIAKNSTIEDNWCYTEFTSGSVCYVMRSKYFESIEGVDTRPENITIRNNTAYMKNPGATTTAYRLAENENGNFKMLGGHVFVNNIAYFASGSTATTSCFDTLSSGTGWPWATDTSTASPTEFTFYAHGMSVGQTFYLTGTLKTGVTANTLYKVTAVVSADVFRYSLASGGADINVTGGATSGMRFFTNGVTATIGSPTIGYTKHGLVADQQIRFASTGTMPTNITSGVDYFVRATNLTTDTFEISATKGGAAVTVGASAGTGIISATRSTSPTLFSSWDNNLCYYAGTTGKWVNPTGSLASWQAYSGFDSSSLTTDPAFAATPSTSNNYSLAIDTTSPAKNAGLSSQSSPTGIFGCRRASADATPDIGAYEFGCSSNKVPAFPTGGRIQ